MNCNDLQTIFLTLLDCPSFSIMNLHMLLETALTEILFMLVFLLSVLSLHHPGGNLLLYLFAGPWFSTHVHLVPSIRSASLLQLFLLFFFDTQPLVQGNLLPLIDLFSPSSPPLIVFMYWYMEYALCAFIHFLDTFDHQTAFMLFLSLSNSFGHLDFLSSSIRLQTALDHLLLPSITKQQC